MNFDEFCQNLSKSLSVGGGCPEVHHYVTERKFYVYTHYVLYKPYQYAGTIRTH